MANIYISKIRVICQYGSFTQELLVQGEFLYQLKRNIMISYSKLWETMKNRGITQYKLINDYAFSAGQLSRLRTNAYISTHTVDTLCKILNCNVEDIMTYIKEES
jgi:DNA-binding Xre family transcriptional regulator